MAKKTPINSLIRADFFGVSADIPRIVEIRMDAIERNPHQPRQIFEESALRELAASISEKGLLQPIVVRSAGDDNYIIVAGERRFRAVQMLERDSIAAIVTEGDSDEIALIENMQREDLKPIELAEALGRLMETHNYAQDVAAKMLGKARNTISELLSLNRILPEIRNECRTSDIASKSVLVELARMEPSEQSQIWESIKQGGTVRAVRVAKANKSPAPPAAPSKKVFKIRPGVTVAIQAKDSDDLKPEAILAALQQAVKAAKFNVDGKS